MIDHLKTTSIASDVGLLFGHDPFGCPICSPILQKFIDGGTGIPSRKRYIPAIPRNMTEEDKALIQAHIVQASSELRKQLGNT